MNQFYCRENELRKLNKRYRNDEFECIVIYGRKHVIRIIEVANKEVFLRNMHIAKRIKTKKLF